jgi:hypothetical protein
VALEVNLELGVAVYELATGLTENTLILAQEYIFWSSFAISIVNIILKNYKLPRNI